MERVVCTMEKAATANDVNQLEDMKGKEKKALKEGKGTGKKS
jgi:hypothetical protein